MANSFEITKITTDSVTVKILLDGNPSITDNGHTLIRISYRKSTVTDATHIDYAYKGNVTSCTETITGLSKNTDYVINVAYKYDAEGIYDYNGAVYIGGQSFTTKASEDEADKEIIVDYKVTNTSIQINKIKLNKDWSFSSSYLYGYYIYLNNNLKKDLEESGTIDGIMEGNPLLTISGLEPNKTYDLRLEYYYGNGFIGFKNIIAETNYSITTKYQQNKVYIYTTKNGIEDWYPATPYIYSGSEWKEATPYIYNGSEWK